MRKISIKISFCRKRGMDMEYGVYLGVELMVTHEDYFKACDEAQQLTKDTGIIHWAMPIQESKWSEQRIKAYMRYVEESEKKIMKLESDYINAQESLRKIIERIESEKLSKRKLHDELYDHGGWMLYDGEWVEVDKQ